MPAVKYPTPWGRALMVGLLNALLLSLLMMALVLSGGSLLPAQPGLLFAETLAGRPLPRFVGLLVQLIYVTGWSCLFIAASYPHLTLKRAVLWGLALWLLALGIVFPVIGWGFMGLALTPLLIPASFIPHLLFGVFLWGASRVLVTPPRLGSGSFDH